MTTMRLPPVAPVAPVALVGSRQGDVNQNRRRTDGINHVFAGKAGGSMPDPVYFYLLDGLLFL